MDNLHKKFIDKNLFRVESENDKLSLLALAMPLFLNLISVNIITMMQTSISSRHLDGFFVIPISISGNIYSFMNNFMLIGTNGLSILYSLYLGKKKNEELSGIFGMAVILSIIIGIVLISIGEFFSVSLLELVGIGRPGNEKYKPYAVKYLRLILPSLIFNVLFQCVNSTQQCHGKTRVGAIIQIVTSAFKILFTYIAVNFCNLTYDNTAEVFAILVVFFDAVKLLLICLFGIKYKIKISFKRNKKQILSILKIGFPASASSIFYELSVLVTTSICLLLTTDAYLAKNYVSQIVRFTYMFGYCIGQANAIMVGRLCGMGKHDLADRMHKQNIKIVIIINFLFSFVVACFSRPLMMIMFNPNMAVCEYAQWIMLIDIAVELGRGMNHVGQFGLNATGDVRFTTIVSSLSCWINSVGLAYVFAILFGLGICGIWIAFAVDELFRGMVYLLRWKSGKWRKLNKKILT